MGSVIKNYLMRLTTFICCLFCIMCFTNDVSAQFIQFTMTVETESGSSVESELNFGVLNPTGTTTIRLGDPNMGIFSISGLATQIVEIELTVDEYLRHATMTDCLDESCRVAVNLMAAYANEGQSVGDVRGVTLLNGTKAVFPISADNASRRSATSLHNVYLYIFGDIEAQDVIPGTYTGNLVLQVEYL